MPEPIGGRYEVELQLGRGGMAVVYRVRDRATGRNLALKQLVLGEDASKRRDIAALFEREYHTLAQLSHPRVIEVYDYGLGEQGPYYTMELLDGGDLRERAPLPWREACALILDVCSPLALLHSRRLLHRDISPRNIRCTLDGTAKLIDFGAMIPMGRGEQIVGTPPFVAPEILHRSILDGRADLFSLGATLYYAVTGRTPFTARDFAHLQESLSQKPPLPSTLVPEVPPALDALIMSLLSLEPAQRPRTVFEVMQRLSAVAEITHVEPVSVTQAYLTTPVMVGREAALTGVRRRILRALNRNGGGLLIRALPGGGRSRMLDATVLEAKTLGARVLRAAASGGGTWTALAEQLVAQLLDVLPELAYSTACAEGLHTELCSEEDGAPRARAFGPGQTARAVQAALVQLMLRLSRHQTLVVLVDDVDELEDAAVGLLAAIAHQAERHGLLLIGNIRHQDGPNGSIALEVLRGACEEIGLPPLSREQTQELLESVFGDVPHVGLLADRIFGRALGNPLYSMDLAQHLVDQGLACYSGGSWTLPSQLDPDQLPVSVEDSFRKRLDALSAPARTLAEIQALTLPKHGALERADYLTLVPELAPAIVDEAIAELLAKQVLASDGRAHVFGQKSWSGVLSALLDAQRRTECHGRLAELYCRRQQPGMVAVHHLLSAGLEARAIELLLGALRSIDGDVTAFITSGTVTPWQFASILERALDAALRLDCRPRDVAELRQVMLGISIPTDSSFYARAAPSWFAQIERDSGLAIWRELGHVADPAERLTRALTIAVERYTATPEAERVYRVDEAIKLLVYYVVVSIAIGTRASDAKLLHALPEVLTPFVKLSPLIEAMQQNAIATRDVSCLCQMESARERWCEVFDRLGTVTGAELKYVEYIRPAIAYGIGLIDARFGLTSALRWAEVLDQDNLQKVNAMYLRRIIRLQQGDAQGAEQCRRQAELLELQATSRQMFSSTMTAELVAYALAADLTGVKQAADRIADMAEREPGWQGYALLSRGLFQHLRGDLGAARVLLEECLALVEPRADDEPHAIVAWPTATAAYLDTLVGLGEYELARSYGRATLAHFAELGIEVPAFDVERGLALAETRLGDYPAGAARLESVIDRQLRLGVSGLPLGASYEARARIAIWAGDEKAVEKYARLTAQEYRHGRGSPLGARYERLMEEARRAGVTLLPQLTEFESTMAVTSSFNRPQDRPARVSEWLEHAQDRQECLTRALELLCEARSANSGHLFLAGPSGLALAASYRIAPPSEALQDFVREFFAREVAGDESVTGIVTDSAVQSMATTAEFTDWHGAVYHPQLIRCQIDGKIVHVGVAALNAVDRRRLPSAGGQVVSAVGTHLVRAGFALGVSSAK